MACQCGLMLELNRQRLNSSVRRWTDGRVSVQSEHAKGGADHLRCGTFFANSCGVTDECNGEPRVGELGRGGGDRRLGPSTLDDIRQMWFAMLAGCGVDPVSTQRGMVLLRNVSRLVPLLQRMTQLFEFPSVPYLAKLDL